MITRDYKISTIKNISKGQDFLIKIIIGIICVYGANQSPVLLTIPVQIVSAVNAIHVLDVQSIVIIFSGIIV
jgi:hypothetical protein